MSSAYPHPRRIPTAFACLSLAVGLQSASCSGWNMGIPTPAQASQDAGEAYPDDDAGSRAVDDASKSVPDAASDASADSLARPDTTTPPSENSADGGAHGCTYTGTQSGTVETLIATSGAAGLIQDFDFDCENLFFTTASGGIFSCPVSGCNGAPTALSAGITEPDGGATTSAQNRIRIGASGLFFVRSGVNTAATPASGSVDVYALGRDGSGVTRLAQVLGFPASCTAAVNLDDISVAPNGLFFTADCAIVGGREAFLSGVLYGGTGSPSSPGASEAAFSPLAKGATDGRPSALVGATVYEPAYNAQHDAVQVAMLTAPAATGATGEAGAAPSTFASAPLVPTSITASSTLVAFSGSAAGDGGVSWVDAGVSFADASPSNHPAVYACAPGAACASPTQVGGIYPRTVTAFYADTTSLYFSDSLGYLFACDVAAVLSGSCSPRVIASPAPSFSQLRGDTDNVYLLRADGSAVVRIPK